MVAMQRDVPSAVRSQRWILRTIATLCFVTGLCAGSLGQETGMPEHFRELPADVVFVLHIPNVERCMKDIASSPLCGAFGDVRESRLYRELRIADTRLRAFDQVVDSLLADLPQAVPGSLTLAFGSVSTARDGGQYNLALQEYVVLADIDDRRFDALLDTVVIQHSKALLGRPIVRTKGDESEVLSLDGDSPVAFMSVEPGLLRMAQSHELLRTAGDDAASLANDNVFASVWQAHAKQSDVFVYVNVRALRERMWPDYDRELRALSTAIGLPSIDGVGWDISFGKDGVLHDVLLYGPQGLTGILAMLVGDGSPPRLEERVPAGWTFFARASLTRPQEAYSRFIEFLDEEAGSLGGEVKRWILEFESTHGLSIESDLLPLVNGEALIALKFPKGQSEWRLLMVETADVAKLSSTMRSLLYPDVKDLSGSEGVDTGASRDPPGQGSSGTLYVNLRVPHGTDDDSLAAEFALGTNRISTDKGYGLVFEHLPSKGVVVAYEDTGAYLGWLASHEGQHVGFLDVAYRPGRDPLSLPELVVQQLVENAGPSGAVVTADANAVRIKAFSRFGFAGLLIPKFAALDALFLPRLLESAEDEPDANGNSMETHGGDDR